MTTRDKTIEECARRLLAKLYAISEDATYKSMFALAHIHGADYTGPNCKQEFDALEAALKSPSSQPARGEAITDAMVDADMRARCLFLETVRRETGDGKSCKCADGECKLEYHDDFDRKEARAGLTAALASPQAVGPLGWINVYENPPGATTIPCSCIWPTQEAADKNRHKEHFKMCVPIYAAALASPQTVEGSVGKIVSDDILTYFKHDLERHVKLQSALETVAMTVSMRFADRHFATTPQLVHTGPEQSLDAEELALVATAINDARYGDDYPKELIKSFEEADESDRIYSIRLARAAIKASYVFAARKQNAQPVHTAVLEEDFQRAKKAFASVVADGSQWNPQFDAALRAALSAAAPASEWPPISEAPKDGVAFIASSDGWITMACWNRHRNRFCCVAPGYPDYPADEQPTHFLPLSILPKLPTLPAPAKEGE